MGHYEEKEYHFSFLYRNSREKANFIQLFQRLKGNKVVINFEIRVAIDGVVCYNTAYMMI